MPRKSKKTADDYTRDELYARAERKGIKYRSRMNKQQLFKALGLGRAARKSAPRKATKATKAKTAKTAKKVAPKKAAAKRKAVSKPAPRKAAASTAKKAPARKAAAKKKTAPVVRKTPVKAKVKAKAVAKTRPVAKRRVPAKSSKAATGSKRVKAVARPEPVLAAEQALPRSSVVPPPPLAAAAAAYIDRGPALPEGYGDDRIVTLVRDPRCIFSYWELLGGGYERARSELGDELTGGVWVLRLVKVTGERFFDVPIDPAIGNWYLHVEPGERYQVKIGLVLPSGLFRELAASLEVVTPAEQVSDVVDEEWMLVREEFDRLVEQILSARVPGGVGSSEILHRLTGLPRRMELFSGSITSPRGSR
jgi:hypothetical protein